MNAIRNLTRSLLCLIVTLINNSNAQDSLSIDYPFLKKVYIEVNVSYSIPETMLYYLYKLNNDTSSVGSILAFELDISRPPSSANLDTTGLHFKGTFMEGHFRRRYVGLSNTIVPVGLPSLPRFWLGGFTNNLTLSISNDTIFVGPGQSVDSLLLMSRGLPGIRKFTARPDFNIFEFFPSYDDTTSTMTQTQMDSILYAVNFYGVTIGPTAPPANFIPLAFLDTLISYKHQAFTLGWIKNQGIVTSLDAKLDNTKAQLQRNNITSARNILQSFLNEVEALNKKGDQITSEAYALLKFNAEYLLSKL